MFWANPWIPPIAALVSLILFWRSANLLRKKYDYSEAKIIFIGVSIWLGGFLMIIPTNFARYLSIILSLFPFININLIAMMGSFI